MNGYIYVCYGYILMQHICLKYTETHVKFSLALWTKERIKEKDDEYSLACLKKNMRLNKKKLYLFIYYHFF